MARLANAQDYKDFYESLTPEQYKIVKQADELWADFFEERLAKEAFDEWDRAGRPKGYTLEQAREMVKAARCS